MKKAILFFSILLGIYGCSSVPITGRKQLSLVSDSEVLTLSLKEYDEFIKSAPKSTDQAATAMVVRVGRNIANAVETYYRSHGMESMLNGYAWEFNLIKSNEVNAFCMPGGKIVVYEGILPYTQDETGLAVVLGHEVAHAVAKHANERVSQQVAAQYGGAILGGVLGGSSSATQNAVGLAYGLGTQYGVLLPFSRKQELEADQLGLIFMAMAGYDPRQAIPFWERMSQQGGSVPEFTSTHPSDQNRIKEIQAELPEALKYYKGGQNTVPSSGMTTSPGNTNNTNNTSPQWTF
ncbi:MAG: M48 family metallopeptidase [Candidatus Azobacteroides sp.]|nr:M48 family metallopeptidase [Candidatus Azobacteroides sp.]